MVERFAQFPSSVVLPPLYQQMEQIPNLSSQMEYASSRRNSKSYTDRYPNIVQANLALYSLVSRRIHLGEIGLYHQDVADKYERGLKVYNSEGGVLALGGKVFKIKDVGDLAILYDLLPGVDVSWILKKYPLLMNQDLDWMFDNGGRSFCVASTHSQKLFLKNELIYVLPPEDLVINFNV